MVLTNTIRNHFLRKNLRCLVLVQRRHEPDDVLLLQLVDPELLWRIVELCDGQLNIFVVDVGKESLEGSISYRSICNFRGRN